MNDNPFLRQFPIRHHPEEAMAARFVSLSIEQQPALFGRLQILMHEEDDLLEIMLPFLAFLDQNDFDPHYSGLDVFGAPCEAARDRMVARPRAQQT